MMQLSPHCFFVASVLVCVVARIGITYMFITEWTLFFGVRINLFFSLFSYTQKNPTPGLLFQRHDTKYSGKGRMVTFP